jgi:vitamin B12/bleomycin/antimicrobial peptide transport system ATP-binding/permease protein
MTSRSRQKGTGLHGYRTPDQKHLFARFWQSASGFWSGWGVWGVIWLLIAVVLLQLLVQYWLNFWNRDFFNALERKDGSALWAQARLFVPLAAASLVLALLSVWGRMTAQRNWREWLTKYLIDYWLGNDRYRRLKLVPGEHEYPEYRIGEDARVATDAPIDLALGLLTSFLSAITFLSILWSVGGDLVVYAFGFSLTLPGYLVIAVIGYSAFLAGTMLFVGRHLTPVIQEKNEAEAAFRSSACHLREVGEGTVTWNHALQQRQDLRAILERVIARWRNLCMQLIRTTIVGHVNFLLAPVLAWILCAPKYLNGAMALGEVVQVAAAFVTVQAALNWFVDNYQRLADWVSSVNRVSSLLLALDQIDTRETTVPSAIIMRVEQQPPLTTDCGYHIAHPTGEPLPLGNAVRCGAKTRGGYPCRSPSGAERRLMQARVSPVSGDAEVRRRT